jgi:uncharacterized protein
MNNTEAEFIAGAKRIFESFDEIKLVYLFGSTARGDRGAMSDYDFAVFVGETNRREVERIRFLLTDELARLLRADKIDVVMLDIVESPELKYIIIREGKLIFEKEPFRLLFEPNVLNEYFDFQSMLKRHGLTKARAS